MEKTPKIKINIKVDTSIMEFTLMEDHKRIEKQVNDMIESIHYAAMIILYKEDFR